jgi:phage terminase large subunit
MQKNKLNITKQDKDDFKMLFYSPIYFIEKAWGLKPQPIKPQYAQRYAELITKKDKEWEEAKEEITAEWFGDYDHVNQVWVWYEFEKGKHITWQQLLFLYSVEKAVKKDALPYISAVSGRGIGKSRTLAWLILWYLFGRPDCQIPCTAPTSDQMYDVLWKEIMICINEMPPALRNLYIWESDHIRIKESPGTWFARAKTSSKENPEALSGVHADYVMAAVDEGSGVPEPIFIAAQGILTSPNVLFVMISQGTRQNGFFYDSHNKSRKMWQNLNFNSEESPIVDNQFIKQFRESYGIDTDEYRINVLGQFPKEDAMDDKNYVALLSERSIRDVPDNDFEFQPDAILGVDPAGEGDNESAWVIRDAFMTQKLKLEKQSTPKTVAQITMTLASKYKILPENIIVDAFGTGADVGKEIAIATQGRWNVRTVNVGDLCDDMLDAHQNEPISKKELFINKRAEAYWNMKKWFEQGGIMVADKKMKDQILTIRFKRNIKGKIAIMPKHEMKKLGLQSPDCADALSMTFLVDPIRPLSADERERQKYIEQLSDEPFDPYSAF